MDTRECQSSAMSLHPISVTNEADLAWIQLNYTLQLLADSRTVRTPAEAVVAHLRCWEKVVSDQSDCRSSVLALRIEDAISFRDTKLASITAEHYGFTLDDLHVHLDLNAAQ